jgi:hypothetical protein
MLNIKVLLIVGITVLITSAATAGTILLLGVGVGTPGGGGCSNSLDFTNACNSQYVTVI